jgi:hypothetical protein
MGRRTTTKEINLILILSCSNARLFVGALQVSLDSRVREIVNRNMVEPTPHTFDEAQLQIYTLMHRDSYPRWIDLLLLAMLACVNTTNLFHFRFINSPLFKTLAQISEGSTDAEESPA